MEIKLFTPRQEALNHLKCMKTCPYDTETACIDSDGKICYKEGYCNYLGLEESKRL